MKFVVLGTSEFTIRCAQALLDSGMDVSLISMPKNALPLNSANILEFAQAHKIPYNEIEDINNSEAIDVIKKYQPDYIFSSWPRIIKKDVIQIPKMVIGTHPTELPHNRGRHPLHWLIILGLSESKLSFFSMDEGVDTGRVLLQIPFSITKNDTVSDLISKVNELAYEGTKKLCEQLKSSPEGIEQDHTKANYWRKRTPHDVILDLRMSSSIILRTVRSFAPPYPCAKLIFENNILPITKAAVANTNLTEKEIRRIEPGKIIRAEGKKITVKVDDSIMQLETNELPQSLLEAKYIHPPTKYLAKLSQEQLKSLEN